MEFAIGDGDFALFAEVGDFPTVQSLAVEQRLPCVARRGFDDGFVLVVSGCGDVNCG
jgi:hypothetical protein